MAGTPSGSISGTEMIYNELSKMRCEGLFCRRCACYYATKDEFNEHIQEHLKETNSGKENFMRYIENYICSKCGEQFEVKSDLIIHYNTVCIDAHYVCKHCKENCENSPFLQMHLLVYHKYSEEMLRDEGFLTDLDENPLFSRSSNMTSFESIPFKPEPSRMGNEYEHVRSMKVKATYSRKYRTSRSTARTGQNLAFNSLDKDHTCTICNESFSRKCVLEIHVQKHALEKIRATRVYRGIPEKYCAINVSENIYTGTSCSMQHDETFGDPEVSELHSNAQRAILKPSNVVSHSSVWKKVQPKRKFRGEISTRSNTVKKGKTEISVRSTAVKKEKTEISARSTAVKKEKTEISARSTAVKKEKTEITTRSTAVKKEKTEISKPETQNASNTKAISPITDNIAVPVSWKKIKLKSKVRKPSEKKECKKSSKNEGKQAFTCEICKKSFKDGYKLKRHFFIHTGARPFTCPMCKKTFTRDDHLKRHIKKVCSKTVNVQIKSEKP